MSKAGIGETTNAGAHPVGIILPATAETRRSGSGPAVVRFEPSLKGFSDYAFGKREFPAPEKRIRVTYSKASAAINRMAGKPSDVYLSQGLN